jgi:hypothetical protein
MKILLAPFLIVLLLPAAIAAAQTASPSPPPVYVAPTPPSDATVLGWAREWLRYMQLGQPDRSMLDDSMNAFLSPDTLLRVQAQLNTLGEPIAVTMIRKISQNGFTEYDFRLRFDNGGWIEYFTLDGNNKIAALRFAPGF